MKPELPCHLVWLGQQLRIFIAPWNLKSLVGIDVQDPVAGRLLQCKVAGRREVVARGKVMQFGWKSAGYFDRPVARAGVDHDDLINVADQRGKTICDEF